MSESLIITLVGPQGSGKSSGALYLERELGFWRHYPGQVIRDAAMKRGVVLQNRDASAAFYAQMRQEQGADVLIRPVLDNIGRYPRMVIDGTRVADEVDALKRIGGVIIALHCDEDVAYSRVVSDAGRRHRLPSTFADFQAQGRSEAYNPDPDKPSVSTVTFMAHEFLDTTPFATEEAYHQRLGALVGSYIRNHI